MFAIIFYEVIGNKRYIGTSNRRKASLASFGRVLNFGIPQAARIMSSSSLQRRLAFVPEEFGLMITFDCEDNVCHMEFVPDQHLKQIHPNAYGPAALNDLAPLGGGGSGVRVFRGDHPVLGPLVMKHGGYKDTKELFALATIAQEIQRRDPTARADMKWRLPEYRMLYISPCHLRDTPRELWSLVSKMLGFIVSSENGDSSDLSNTTHSTQTLSTLSSHGTIQSVGSGRENGSRRDILLYTSSSDGKVRVTVNSARLKVVLGSDDSVNEGNIGFSLRYGAVGDGYSSFESFVDKLIPCQQRQFWKFTQGQKTIGSPSSKTGLSYLSKGELCGCVLDTLIREYVQVIRNLQDLTLPEEAKGVDVIREEVKHIKSDPFMRPVDISDEADAFVGFAIKKNWDPKRGRFFNLRLMGKDFRSNSVTLTKQERLPARLLGILLKPGSSMSAVFLDAPNIPTALDTKGFKVDTWRDLLQDAVKCKSSAALKRIWSCGVADGGLHNLFLTSEQMWLFDLGEPTLQPLPAFLTKFLFSFFHGLGMVDDKVAGCWVNRFVPGKKLALTEETKVLTAKAYAAFKITLDRFIEVLFDKEEAVRGLLINYITMQLLSDAGFCLDRWVIKGGGKPRAENHHKNLEQWLWRAIWDIYIASDLNTNRRLLYVGAKVDNDPASMYGPTIH
jgi:hypothetical protein